ncbi:microtubule-associated protein CRIPT protein [Rhizoctonia solani]|uniref:Microtubule-associated protein CRIPT protein n=1 Tax=Rhizoctonia solani TaxID=456999 RepID=A0A8H8SXA3_9AGAM|nr:microtubule-associated protein CRIPT protein [Rhizoctonia solani]QRW21324.1 microtubule-associated protein CRIPT protein [Rhizoctonia solani]
MAAAAKVPVSRKRALSAAPPPSFEACVVTYFSQDRAFQRVFAETDIEGMKTVVREKLNLPPHAGVRLAQMVDGRRIDLEDDADFYAFQLGAQLKPELQVEVSVIVAPAAQLASPSVTATSINLERAPPPTLTQTGQDTVPQVEDSSASVPPPAKKKKKPRKSNLVIVENDTGGNGKPVEPIESTTTENSEGTKAKAKEATTAPFTTTTEPSKKPKSKAATKSTPPIDQQASSNSETSKQPTADVVTEAPPVPRKSTKSKKTTAPTPAPAAREPEPEPEPTPASAPTETIPETSSVPTDANAPQARSKKRGRKVAQDVDSQEPAVPEPTAQAAAEPPVKKRRKSKLESITDLGGTQSPVGTSLPPPVRSKRRGSTAASVPDTGKPVSVVGSATDILRRWGALSIANETAISGAVPSTATDVVEQSMETKGKAKRKRKKKDQVADDASTSTSAPVATPAETAQCLLCSSGPHEALNCPLLSQRDDETCKTVEGRIYHLEDTQGPTRIHQMLIGRLRSWLKETKKQVEAQNKSITPTPAPVVPQSASPVHSTPAPTRPKKSKLSSVAVSHQSEGSSTEDEDILKSVMESRIESPEEDDGEDEEMVDIPQPEPEPAPEPLREASPPSMIMATPSPPQPAPVPLPPSSPLAKKALLQSQRMSRSSVFALLDGLESEEAGEGEKDSSDDEASDLAQSTPSEVARRRHRKSVRLDVQDSDEEAAARGQALPQDHDESDVEMQDGDLTTLSQLLASPEPEEIVGVVDDDDIEEYDDDKEARNKSPDSAASSPIEAPDQEPVVEEVQDPVPAKQEEATETVQEEEPEPEQELEQESKQEPEPISPAPKKRGRPPLSQAIKDERAAERGRIQAEKAALQDDTSAPKKRGRSSRSKGADEQTDVNVDHKPKSSAPSTQEKPVSVAGSQESAPRSRGRPRLSETVKAEREAEKERIRAERAIQRLEKKTAKANAKAAAKGKGADANAAVDEDSGDEGDTTVRQSPPAPEETIESPIVPTWSTLNNPSSSRHGSSQNDEIESSVVEAPRDVEEMDASGFQLSAVKPTPNTRSNGNGPVKPLFMPSSGLVPRFLPPSSPITSTPAPNKLQSLTQQTPSNTLQRRRSMGSASLPRFTDIKKNRDIEQRSRKERNRLLSSQPAIFDSSHEAKSKPNGPIEEVVMVESDEEEVDSSDEEAKKPKSQRKRPSALAYFSQR